MATSANYDVTKEDSRQWRTYQDATALAANEAAVANAAALQTSTRATNATTAISVSPATVTLDISDEDTQQLTVTTTPEGVNNQYTYVSSDPTKGTVSSTGLITPVAAGETTVTVTAVATGDTDTCVVTVQA